MMNQTETTIKKRKLKFNIAVGVVDILLSLLSLVALPMIFAESFADDGDAHSLAYGFVFFMIIGLVLHIVGLIRNKSNKISMTGHILGIVGTGIYALFGAIMSLPTLVLLILATIFVFIQKNIKVE